MRGTARAAPPSSAGLVWAQCAYLLCTLLSLRDEGAKPTADGICATMEQRLTEEKVFPAQES